MTFFIEERIFDFNAMLCWRRTSACLARLAADLILATGIDPLD